LAELEIETTRIALGFFVLTFFIAAHPVAAYSPIRGLQEETPISNEEASIESYFILDVVGEPSIVSDLDVELLEKSFLEAFNIISSCNSSYRVLENVAVLRDAIASYGNNDEEHVGE
jgi:hypothetical protein